MIYTSLTSAKKVSTSSSYGGEVTWWTTNAHWVILLSIIISFSLIILVWWIIAKYGDKIKDTVSERVDESRHATVVYRFGDGREDIGESVLKGSRLFLTIPFRQGYTFGGWFIDSALTIPWVSTDKVKTDMTLYAKWVKEG